jgi:hypothetical protein
MIGSVVYGAPAFMMPLAALVPLRTWRGLSPRGSLLKPAADQQVQSSHNDQDAYYREHCDYPEEHS